MQIRPLTLEYLDLFVGAGGSLDHRKQVRQYLDRMFAAGSMRPDWWFVAERGDLPVGRVAFWTLPGVEHPFALVLLDVDWDADYAAVGAPLLENVLKNARALGSRKIEHVIDDPPIRPQFQHHPERRVELLESVGFSLSRKTSRFERHGTELPTERGRLSYRTLEEVGEEPFVEAMAEVSEGTLDREIGQVRERLGAIRAAQDFFDDARKVQHDPSWWRLAYTPNGDLAGLVMPAEPPGFLTLFYLGVVPAMRGRGYVDDLLATGTATLLEARRKNDKPLITDTDVANSPMAAAFERAGWTRFAERREYVMQLDSHRA